MYIYINCDMNKWMCMTNSGAAHNKQATNYRFELILKSEQKLKFFCRSPVTLN